MILLLSYLLIGVKYAIILFQTYLQDKKYLWTTKNIAFLIISSFKSKIFNFNFNRRLNYDCVEDFLNYFNFFLKLFLCLFCKNIHRCFCSKSVFVEILSWKILEISRIEPLLNWHIRLIFKILEIKNNSQCIVSILDFSYY